MLGVVSRAMKDKVEQEKDHKSLELVEQRLREKAEVYNNFVQGGSLDHKQLEKVCFSLKIHLTIRQGIWLILSRRVGNRLTN